MKNILNFDSFNEGWFSNLTKSIGNFFGASPFSSILDKYDIEAEKESDECLNFFHDDKLIAKISLDAEFTNYPIWNLVVYIYQSETPAKAGVKITNQSFEGQDEQPYGETSLKIKTGIENAVKSLVGWWETYTKSGRKLNPRFRID